MTTQIGMTPSDPYVTPSGGTYTGTPGSAVFEITLTTSLATAISPIVSGTTNIHAETYNGAIPGPTLRLFVGDTVIVRLINNMPHETGIHWHGIELGNSADGTEVTQKGAVGAFPPPPAPAPAGGTYLYKFKLIRPGIYWYHPHHHHSTNRVFKGLYGMIVVTDSHEETLVGNTLPAAIDTKQLVLSDITVCKTAGMNDPATYPTAAGTEWLGSTPTIQAGPAPTTPQPGPTPVNICELPTAVDDHGDPAAASYAAGDVPSLETSGGRVNEGQTVLTNGVNVGGRAGSPGAPGALASGAFKLPVRPGQGLRLQIVNCATTRYFRLRLTDGGGNKINLVRVGGEGGLLDRAVLEGGVIPDPLNPLDPPFDTKYNSGEILLPPSVRADVVAVIPNAPGSVLTLWTRDFPRLLGAPGGPFAQLPSVPVMHLEVTNDPLEAYSITGGPNDASGTPLRAKVGFPGPAVATLGVPNGTLLNPATFIPSKPGDPATWVPPAMVSEIADIKLTSGTPSINGIPGHDLHGPPPYPNTPHIESSRYAAAAVGRILELTVTNMTQAHHPFHLHGFSMQPISLTQAGNPTFTWGYREFRDSIDVPSSYKLTFRILLDDRTFVDGQTLGGWLGRWLFHCHIFFHHHRGMISEFVVTGNTNGKERPYVDVGGSWAYAISGGTTTRNGTYSSLDGSTPISLEATYGPAGGPVIGPLGTVVPASGPGGSWSWTNPVIPDGIYYVYIKATDSIGLQGQCVFRLKIGAPDDGADVGDPHIRTVDGKSYDFQAVGEFTLLRDRDGLEIQTRQTPLETASQITDNYTGLTSGVSVNTAVAARVGSHKISYQPVGVGANSQLQFFLDGKPSDLSARGIDLDGHRVSSFDANGEMGLRVDYAHGAVLIATPRFWNLWFLDIWVSHTHADEGIMGSIPEETWLPTLPSGATVGPMPEESLHERYITLYKIFADAWRVTNKSSLFTYTRGTSTETFTDKDWPAEQPPSILKPQFQIPGFLTPVNIPVAEAEGLCKGVTIDHLNANCVFDVATTGDKGFAKAYLFQQDLRLNASAVQITGDKAETRSGEPLVVTAIVSPLTNGRPTPTGSVIFFVNGAVAGPSVKLDPKGRAQFTTDGLAAGEHKISATYSPDGEYHFSMSPNLNHTVKAREGYDEGSTSGCQRTIWIWILIIVVLIAIAVGVYFC